MTNARTASAGFFAAGCIGNAARSAASHPGAGGTSPMLAATGSTITHAASASTPAGIVSRSRGSISTIWAVAVWA